MLICGLRPMLDEADRRRGEATKGNEVKAQGWHSAEQLAADSGPIGAVVAAVTVFGLVMTHRGVGFALLRRLLLVMLLTVVGALLLPDLVESGKIANTWSDPWEMDLWVIQTVTAVAIGVMALNARLYWVQSVDAVRYRGLDASLGAMFVVQIGLGGVAAFCAGILIWTHDVAAPYLTPMFVVLALSLVASALLYFIAWRRQMVLAGRAWPWIF